VKASTAGLDHPQWSECLEHRKGQKADGCVPNGEWTSIDDCEEARGDTWKKKSKGKKGEIEHHDGGRAVKAF
jgi:hypothetical protein